jgi:DNA-binding transcriptional MerR regulator
VSQRTGVPAKTIRYYESVGLLPPPPRSANAYRRYTGVDINRLLLLRRIKLLGAPLADAKRLLKGATDARCVDAQEALLALVDNRLIVLDQQIAELRALRDEVSDYRSALASCRADDSTTFADCPDMRCLGAPPDRVDVIEASAICAHDDHAEPASCCSASKPFIALPRGGSQGI